jgi:hypothetical protein
MCALTARHLEQVVRQSGPGFETTFVTIFIASSLDNYSPHGLNSDIAPRAKCFRACSRRYERPTVTRPVGGRMSNDFVASAVTPSAAVEHPRSPWQQRLWPEDDDVVLPLPAKTAALHARRQRRALVSKVKAAGSSLGARQVQLCSEDGAIGFVLQRSQSHLHLQRTQRRPLGMHVVHHMVFSDEDAFERWRNAEPIRFDYPVLFGRLSRSAHDFLNNAR